MWRLLTVMSAAAFALAIAASAFANAPPSPPHQFFGSGDTGSGAHVDGALAADGATVTASNEDGVEVGSTTITDGTWLIQVDPADADSVTFTIDGSAQSESQDVVSGSLTELGMDLAASGDAAATAPATATPDGLPSTGTGGLANDGSGLPILPLALAVSLVLALGGVAVTRRSSLRA